MANTRTTKYGGAFAFTESGDGSINTKTLQDVFDAEKAQAKEIEKLKREIQKDTIKQQEKSLLQSYKNIEAQIQQARMDGVKNLASMEARLKKDAITKEYQDKLKRQNDIYKKEMDKVKKDARSNREKLADNTSQFKENSQMLKFYQELMRGGTDLTDEQKQDKARLEVEQEQLKQDIKQQTKQEALTKALENLTNSVNANINTYNNLQKGTNARLQGKSMSTADRLWAAMNGKSLADTYSIMENKLTTAVGINPYFKTESMLTNLSNLINEGISSNVEQRAFLQTASENIATTFDVANGALLRIVRLQQGDSSAARLGMEAYLTRFLNELVDNTEYLNSTFDSVQEALLEASSQMSLASSTEWEYVVQKWLGSLVGVGMSDSTATSIAQALGYLGSGNIDALNSSDLQNLLVMAASKAGLSYSDLLTSGLNATSTDALMNSLVAYLAEVNQSGNNVIKSQLASTFGVSYSDLAAASNLAASADSIYGNTMSLGSMYNELAYQMGQIPGRMSTSALIDTLWSNLEFNLASNIASTPALAAIWKVTDLIGSATGGIPIQTITTMFGGVDMETTVDNLIKLGVVGTSSLGLIGDLLSGLGTSLSPASALLKLGISSGSTTISRGTGMSTTTSGLDTSSSGIMYISNSSGSDIQESALASAKDEATSNQAYNEEEEAMQRASLDIKNYLIDTFDSKFGEMSNAISDIRDDVNKLSNTVYMNGGIYGA